jgi:predicted Zn-dependent protease
MRHIVSVLALAAPLLLTACDQGSGQKTNLDPGKTSVDTAPLERSFQTAEPTAKDRVNNAIALVKAGNYQAALTELQGLLTNLKLTPEQQQSIQDTIARIKDKVSTGANDAINRTKEGAQGALDRAREGTSKATDDVKKTLGQ